MGCSKEGFCAGGGGEAGSWGRGEEPRPLPLSRLGSRGFGSIRLGVEPSEKMGRAGASPWWGMGRLRPPFQHDTG